MFVFSQFPAAAESRRAVLVGIKTYNPDLQTRRNWPSARESGVVHRPAWRGDALYWEFRDLDGPLNDVELMKGVLQTFGIDDFVILTEAEATADGILSALQKNLVDDAAPGDVRVFYYSGHGNHVRNLASREHGEDQTLVPADNWRNIPDIRDKEISRILWRAARKGVSVTFIADSCHSGSLARGAWNERGKARTNSGVRSPGDAAAMPKLVEPEVNDPPDTDAETKLPIDPESLGVLTLAAAQQNQQAIETRDEGGKAYGAFTLALARSLRNPKEPMDRVFQRMLANLRADSIAQEPVMGGRGRGVKGIFGDDAVGDTALTAVVESVAGSNVELRGGTAIGLYPGCRLKNVVDPEAIVEITASVGISGSTGRLVRAGSVRKGDLLEVEHWTVPAAATLRVYMPSPIAAGALWKVVREIGKLRDDPNIHWVEDATTDTPTHVMSWSGKTWLLERNPARGMPVNLGNDPAAKQVEGLLSRNGKFLLLLPPTSELSAALHLDDANHSAVLVQGPGKQLSSPVGAQYRFCGRLMHHGVEYAWVLPDATEPGVRSLAGQARGVRPSGYMPLPIRSRWITLPKTPDGIAQAGASLADTALQLGRIRAWFTLSSPAAQTSFPYHLVLKKAGTEQFRTSGDLVEGEEYKLYLQANAGELKSPLAPRWVYIFVVDHFGRGSLLFPRSDYGNDANHLPYAQLGEKPRFEPMIAVTGETWDFWIDKPFGVDTFFLLTSDEPIDNPHVLEFKGVRSDPGTRGERTTDPLSNLLRGMGAGRRSSAAIPSHWSIEKLTFRSVRKTNSGQ